MRRGLLVAAIVAGCASAPQISPTARDTFIQLERTECIATDYPESIVTVSRRGEARRLVHNHADPCAPRAIERLEARIDSAGGWPQLMPSVQTDE